MPIISILLPLPHLGLLSYLLPAEITVVAGDLVWVPFRNRELIGIVWSQRSSDDIEIKKLKQVLCKANFRISLDLIKLIDGVSQYYMRPLGDVAKLVLALGNNIDKQPKTAAKTTAKPEASYQLPLLNQEQEEGLSQLQKTDSIALLYGITGSGKTALYFHRIAEVLKQQKQILVLLPEIALTMQIMQRFAEVFGFEPAIWHSGISAGRKLKIFHSVAKGEEPIVIGARSSLFLPFKNLGLIIIDEEHSESYKQDTGVSYHAREVASLRRSIENIPLLLCSATPSLEAFYQAKAGKYMLVKLTKRYHEVSLPDIELIDMLQVKSANKWISPALIKAIKDTLTQKQQVLLFLNRRGYAPLLLCNSCAFRIMCPSCSVWLVARKSSNSLSCHHCGYSTRLSLDCPNCGGEKSMIPCGPGVERITEIVKVLFPEARLLTISSDNMTTPKQISSILSEISEHKADIIIGTQIIAKGYHFPRIQLVGIVNADLGMDGGDLRATEKNFQLLQQAGGRAGREQAGKVFIQTRFIHNAIFEALRSGDFDRFVELELKLREDSHLPPFSNMVALILRGKHEETLYTLARNLINSAPTESRMRLLGPAPAGISKLKNLYRVRILSIAPRDFDFPSYYKQWLDNFPLPSSVDYTIDVDPYNFS